MSDRWQDVLVLGEPLGTQPSPGTLEVLGKARDLADRLGARVSCAWRGGEENGLALAHGGADELVLLEGGTATGGTVARGLADLVRDRRFEMVLASATPFGQEVLARLAAALRTGMLGYCVDFDLDEETRLLIGVRRPGNGALVSKESIPQARPQVATLQEGAARAPWPDESRSARIHRIVLPTRANEHVRPLGTELRRTREDWQGAERLVVGGALLDARGFEDLRAVAAKIEAGWAATRAAVQLGLAPEERALRPWDGYDAPRLCLAAGIEDALEFRLSLPQPGQLIALGPGALGRVASLVVEAPASDVLRALAERLGA
jgi:electron transfer flavoprotein alpha subunit